MLYYSLELNSHSKKYAGQLFEKLNLILNDKFECNSEVLTGKKQFRRYNWGHILCRNDLSKYSAEK